MCLRVRNCLPFLVSLSASHMAGYAEGTRYQEERFQVNVDNGETAAELGSMDIPDSQELRAR